MSKYNKQHFIEEFASRGSSFKNGKQRIIEYFKDNLSKTDRANFLKKEYGVGGFGTPCNQPYVLFQAWHDAKEIHYFYYNKSMKEVEAKITYTELAETIARMIEEGTYLTEWEKEKNKHKIVIGIDQSYTRTGITVLYDKQLVDILSVDFPQCKTKNEKRIYLESMLDNVIKYTKQGGVIEETFHESVPDDITIIVERIRLKSQGVLNQNYIMSTGALVASIVRIAEQHNIPVYSVDTRSWKSNIVGSSKPLENPYGINTEKYRTILYMRDRGLLKHIVEPYKGKGKKGIIGVKMDVVEGGKKVRKKVPCKINDDMADSYCMALYGFLPEDKQKLEVVNI